MHELSIATRVVEMVTEYAQQASAAEVIAVTLRIGVFSGIQKSALTFGFEVAAEGTPVEGAALRIIEVPLVAYCDTCRQEVQLPSLQSFVCPICGQPTADIRKGRELDLDSIEFSDTGQAEYDQANRSGQG
jgi:hydrogenase nickel incorporation protein HypA/HybF